MITCSICGSCVIEAWRTWDNRHVCVGCVIRALWDAEREELNRQVDEWLRRHR